MIPRFTQVSTACLLVLLGALGGLWAQEKQPSAEEILRAARMSPLDRSAALDARLRTDAGKTPFTISLERGVITYAFTNPEQRIQLVLGENASQLREQSGGASAVVRPARHDEPVRGSGITYEDLALKLLYWPEPKLLGEETIRTRKAWKLEMQAPKGESQYAAARVWIDRSGGAVLRIEGYGADGRILKAFEMLSAQKIAGQWMLKTMRVQSYDPKTHKPASRTYLEVIGESGQP